MGKDVNDMVYDYLAAYLPEGYLIVAEIQCAGEMLPTEELDAFVQSKIAAIETKHITGRKFVFQAAGWRMYLTFYPANQPVDERYALKNKVIRKHLSLRTLAKDGR